MGTLKKPMKHATAAWIKARVLHGTHRGKTPEQIAYDLNINIEKVNETLQQIIKETLQWD